MYKKSQSISINTIIVAAIALAVLVVLFAIFTGRLGSFSKGVSEAVTCESACKSAGMEKTNSPPEGVKGCTTSQTYIAGTYTDGQFGCCCAPKT